MGGDLEHVSDGGGECGEAGNLEPWLCVVLWGGGLLLTCGHPHCLAGSLDLLNSRFKRRTYPVKLLRVIIGDYSHWISAFFRRSVSPTRPEIRDHGQETHCRPPSERARIQNRDSVAPKLPREAIKALGVLTVSWSWSWLRISVRHGSQLKAHHLHLTVRDLLARLLELEMEMVNTTTAPDLPTTHNNAKIW